MQRKPGFPVANCNIKVPDGSHILDESSYITCDDEIDQQRKRQQLINFGHSQWGFNNWSWSVSKQDLDFVDFANGKYTAGVVAYVSITVKNLDIHRENIGYATSMASMKGSAIYKSRKGAVTNALRETLLSFGGSVATELTELLLTSKPEVHPTTSNPEPIPQENNQNIINKPLGEPKNLPKQRKEEVPIPTPPQITTNPVVKIPPRKPPVAVMPPANKPFPANQPPRAPQPPPPRPSSNVSYVLPMMGGVPPLYQPRMPQIPPQVYPNYYAEYTAGPWHFTYEGFDRHHGNVNLNFNIPPKNIVVNNRPGECKNACGEPLQYQPAQSQCWIKPTIFYDGFWTEQKVKKWVAEQVEKQFPEDCSRKSTSPGNGHN